MLSFFVIATTVWILAHAYVAQRLLAGWPATRHARYTTWATGATGCALGISVMTSGRLLHSYDGLFGYAWTAFLYMGLFSMVFAFVGIRDLALGLSHIANLIKKRISKGSGQRPYAPADPSRRDFLLRASSVGIGAATGVLGVWGVTEARRIPRVVPIDFAIAGLPKALEGYRIAQLTDVHVGPTLRAPFVEALVEKVNALHPDAVAITGDLVDGTVPMLRDQVRPLRFLESVDGSFFVTGNHEYYWDALAWSRELERLGIRTLHNEHALVRRAQSSLVIAGATDFTAGRFVEGHASDPAKALDGAPSNTRSVLLAHQPRSVHAAAQAGFDVQLSGHTHGGQTFPWNLVVGLAHPIARGLGTFGPTQIYVSSGTGYWGPPLRAGVPSEITLVRLVRASGSKQS